MRRTALSGLAHMSTAAALAIALAACGTASSTPTVTSTSTGAHRAGPAASLSVRPSRGTPATVFELRFTAPASSAVSGGVRRGFQLGLAGPAKSGCVSSRSVPVPPVARGQTTSIPLDPAKLGGRWCVGTYTARMLEVQTPVCAAGTVCPQFIRVVGTVGRVAFRVTGAA